MEGPEGEAVPHVAEKMAPALISVHPECTAVVVAIGADLRIFDLRNQRPVNAEGETNDGHHGEAIRAVVFNKEGNLFASAGDDKRVTIWDTNSWTCIKTSRLAKKVTGLGFSQDSKWLLFADKFGVVFVMPTSATEAVGKPLQLLAHCCSIITDLKLSPDGKYVITSDRDFKIRVSVFPAVPTNGAHEIWSYCLGHTSFVTCVAFVGERCNDEHLLVSGSGDATVRLWDYKSGRLLDTFDTTDIAELNDGGRVENTRAIIGVSVAPAGSVIAVIIERYAGVMLVEYDGQLKKLKYLQSFAFAQQVCPTGITFDARGSLWLVAGAVETVDSSDRCVTPAEVAAAESKARSAARSAVTQVRLIMATSTLGSTKSAPSLLKGCEDEGRLYEFCEDAEFIPGGEALLQALQGGRDSSGSELDNAVSLHEVAVAAEAAELAMRKMMTKRQYTVEQREIGKRMRNDKKLENKSTR